MQRDSSLDDNGLIKNEHPLKKTMVRESIDSMDLILSSKTSRKLLEKFDSRAFSTWVVMDSVHHIQTILQAV